MVSSTPWVFGVGGVFVVIVIVVQLAVFSLFSYLFVVLRQDLGM